MLDTNIILKRLKTHLNVKTDLQLSKILKVKPNTISSWKKRNSMQFDSVIDVCETHHIDLNELLYGVNKLKLPYAAEGKDNVGVKMISSDMQFQYVLQSEKILPSLRAYHFPFLDHCEIAFQVISENMTPTIRVSSFAICQKANLLGLVEGNIYVLVDFNKGIFLHRFKSVLNAEELLFTSDNSFFNDKIFRRESIGELWEIKAAYLGNMLSI
ncbi:helix-turn-helix domain-containing protein [Flavobacterium sp. NKUCC04_CG]|uniref:helix-turn-helix domain-containing protein n=1 Tax=Flavobacterium sp. NKUCC04_CG TaxID=2842121 RepID=UPI0021076028|nr:helix-turn-helix domain-containing protein [Flavobacterium sp. NKUCC04_CG]